MKVRYTPSHASGEYVLDLTEDQWQGFKDSPDYQLMSAEDIAAHEAALAPPVPPAPVPGSDATDPPAPPPFPEPPPPTQENTAPLS